MDQTKEVAFYVDEAGPYLIKPQPGQKWCRQEEVYKTPATWKTKGKLVVFGALKTNPGKVYHHIDDNKRHQTLLHFIWRLAKLCAGMKKIYLIWDNAKAHKTKAVEERVKRWNKKGGIKFKVLPLPTYNPWLNPIEPVFGDLYKKVIAGSNFRWPCNMADTIHKYLRRRNGKMHNKHHTVN